jgi:hypothetical protein
MSVVSGEIESQVSDEYYNEDSGIEQVVDAQILPGDSEKGKLLSMFDDLRKESTFCDVAFLCKGKLFRAHRVVVSGWSRWLRALLSEGSSEEVVHLDVFDPVAFNSVLDYMYGHSITVTVDSAEMLLKVIRRLELHGLEQSMWIFLMKAIDNHNCNQLHELADRYDCPPLKLAAWRYIQQVISGASKHRDNSIGKVYKGTGLTGPGEAAFYRNVTIQEKLNEERELMDNLRISSGVLSSHSRKTRNSASRTDDLNDEDGNEEDKAQDAIDQSIADDDYDMNENIDRSINSSDFVNAWSRRLSTVYRDCTVDPNDIQQNDATLAAGQRSILLGSRAKHKPTSDAVSAPTSTTAATSARDRTTSGLVKSTSGKHLTPGDIDWHSELKGFYLGINKPDKLPFLDEMLTANEGREEQMLSHIMMKYKRIIPESLANHLDTLQGFLETHSEYPYGGNN